ncbi:MAG: 23S rRNA (uracil(1939)-C(5))-methyltransferase RlmD [Firmicutes bacterium]|nr:23S rRNA (uracil(1939)-C(5))-methyltransferase RlmD [Bacillota bacterium]
MVKKGSILTVTIADTVFPNKGVAYVDGERVIVHDALEGQTVRIKITKKRGSKIEAKILEVLERSPLEQEAPCAQFGTCGGCTYLHIPYESQLELKTRQVLELLADAGIQGFEFLGIQPSPNVTAYRNKMEYTFGDTEDGILSLGLHRKRMRYEVSPVAGCQLVDEDFLSILDAALDYLRSSNVPFYHKKSHQGVLRHLVIRKAGTTGEILVNLVTTSQGGLELAGLVQKLLSLDLMGTIKGILHTINDGKADAIQVDALHVLWGRDYITEKILGLTFRVTAFSFFQTNSHGAEKLFTVVRDFAGQDLGVVFDLYCGTGTIAQIISPQAKKVIGIEIVPEAIEAARKNAQLNGLDNCRFIVGDVLAELDNLQEKPDLVILDPPRSGIHPKALDKLIAVRPPRLVYVSCQPVSLARDLAVFSANGYRVVKVRCVDMFPHTPHVECVTLISRVENI